MRTVTIFLIHKSVLIVPLIWADFLSRHMSSYEFQSFHWRLSVNVDDLLPCSGSSISSLLCKVPPKAELCPARVPIPLSGVRAYVLVPVSKEHGYASCRLGGQS